MAATEFFALVFILNLEILSHSKSVFRVKLSSYDNNYSSGAYGSQFEWSSVDTFIFIHLKTVTQDLSTQSGHIRQAYAAVKFAEWGIIALPIPGFDPLQDISVYIDISLSPGPEEII